MVVSTKNVEQVRAELRAAIDVRMAGMYVLLAIMPKELFLTQTEPQKELLHRVQSAFSKAVHDVISIKTMCLRLETILSVPEIESNQREQLLEAEVDLFFSYAQSICDYLAEAVNESFGLPLGKSPSFHKLLEHLKKTLNHHLPLQLIDANDSDWIAEVRGIRNQLVHRGATPRVMTDFQNQQVLVQVFDDQQPMITTVLPALFSVKFSSYVDLVAYCGVTLGRLIAFANSVADICIRKLEETIPAPNRSAINAALPHMALAIDWIKVGLATISPPQPERPPAALNSDTSLMSGPVTAEKLVAFLDRNIAECRQNLRQTDLPEKIMATRGLVNLLTNAPNLLRSPLLNEQSVHSIRAQFAMRMYRDDLGSCLSMLADILEKVRNEVGCQQTQFGHVDQSWTMERLVQETALTPLLNPSLGAPQIVRWR